MRSHRLRAAAGNRSAFSFDDSAYGGFFTSGSYLTNMVRDTNKYAGTNAGTSKAANPVYLNAFYDYKFNRIWLSTLVINGNYSAGWVNKTFSTTAPRVNNSNVFSPYYELGATHGASVTYNALTDNSSSGLDYFVQNTSYASLTIAYLQDDTPVLVFCSANTSGKIHFWTHTSTPSYIGYMTTAEPLSSGNSNINMTYVTFSGTQLLTVSGQATGYVYGFDLPANTSAINGGTLVAQSRWVLNNNFSTTHFNYGIAFTGTGLMYPDASFTFQTITFDDDGGYSSQYVGGANDGSVTNGANYGNYFGSNNIDYKYRNFVHPNTGTFVFGEAHIYESQ